MAYIVWLFVLDTIPFSALHACGHETSVVGPWSSDLHGTHRGALSPALRYIGMAMRSTRTLVAIAETNTCCLPLDRWLMLIRIDVTALGLRGALGVVIWSCVFEGGLLDSAADTTSYAVVRIDSLRV